VTFEGATTFSANIKGSTPARTGGVVSDPEKLYTILQLAEVMRTRYNVTRSRQEWQRRARLGQFGELVGTQYIVRESELDRIAAMMGKDA
jgi:hypothetical protein